MNGSTPRRRSAPLVVLALVASACSTEPARTSLRITAWGEDYIEQGIPAEVLSDGWAISFDRFLVAIDAVDMEGTPLPGAFVVDLTQPSMGEGHALGEVLVPAEDHPHLSFEIHPVTEAQAISASEDDRTQLLDEGLSMLVEGEATRGGETIGFSWGFATSTRYHECHGAADLADDPDPSSQLTIHADHLFYDDLDSEEPNVAFDLVASADADGDGEVTPAELRAVDISTQTRYQVGSRDITDLWGFIETQTGTVGHIDGEGHCAQR
ncbi:MAG: hypothetical protein KDK70_42290 [Myxococcales bacterium]|nr:hypothetical protein [Myxococcales bacterium]